MIAYTYAHYLIFPYQESTYLRLRVSELFLPTGSILRRIGAEIFLEVSTVYFHGTLWSSIIFAIKLTV